MVQHGAVRFVLNKPWHKSRNHDSVTEMLTNLGWPKLEERRKIARLTVLFKIMRGPSEVPARCIPQLNTAQKAMKDEKIETRLANETRNTCYVFHCSPIVKHR